MKKSLFDSSRYYRGVYKGIYWFLVLFFILRSQLPGTRKVRHTGCDRLRSHEHQFHATSLHRLFYGHHLVFHICLGKTGIPTQDPFTNQSCTSSLSDTHEIAYSVSRALCEYSERKSDVGIGPLHDFIHDYNFYNQFHDYIII